MTDPRRWTRAALGMGAWRPWLTGHGSLTERLQARCAEFRVRRLRQCVARPHPDESRQLGLRRGRLAVIREVLLLCGDTPLIFAHTVIPLAGLRGPWQSLAGLGNRPLGAALFADPRIARFPLEYRRLDARHPLLRSAARHLGGDLGGLWARRSRFARQGRAILVTEVFLPAVLRLPSRNDRRAIR
jgi:chorismate--pyruvate lyase